MDGVYGRTVLDNGIRVLTETTPFGNAVSIGIWFESGSRHEPAGRNGISHFLEHMLFKGTATRSAAQIAREIDAVGGVLNAFTGREFTCYYARVLRERLPVAVSLLADIISNPRLDPEDIDKERQVILQEISMVEDVPEDQIHELLFSRLWGGHPLGSQIIGDAASIAGFTTTVLREVATASYAGRRMIVSVAGPVGHTEIVEEIRRFFASIPAGEERREGEPPVVISGSNSLRKPLEQMHLCLGYGASRQNHPDRYALNLLNTLLGGGMSSRLFQSIREEKGLAYSVYSYLTAHSDAGAMVIYAGVAPKELNQTILLIREELADLSSRGVTAEELQRAKDQVKGGLLLSLDSADARMTRLAQNEIYFGRLIEVEEVVAGFEAVTLEDVRRVASSLFIPQNEYLFLIGPTGCEELPASVGPVVCMERS